LLEGKSNAADLKSCYLNFDKALLLADMFVARLTIEYKRHVLSEGQLEGEKAKNNRQKENETVSSTL